MKYNVRIIIIVLVIIYLIPSNANVNAISDNVFNYDGILRTVECSTVVELQNALKNAQAGDRIVIEEGVYEGAWMNNGWYYSSSSGTKENPIILESKNSNNKSILCGKWNSGGVLTIAGNYWIVNSIKFTKSQKGIFIDKGNNNIITNCEVYDITMEGIHFRDGSSNNLLINTIVHDTGTTSKGMGEGIYVGSDKGKWNEFIKECDNNVIKDCIIGPNVASEGVDIKEGTSGTIVENCTFIGDGISGENYADSFIDIKGNHSIIRGNKFYRNNNVKILDGVQIHVQVDGWGLNNTIENNMFYLDSSEPYILNNSKGTATVKGNIRYPEGNMYKGDNTIVEVYKKEDVNKDGKIDIEDLSIVALSYNRQVDNNIIEYDVIKDGIVDLFDLVCIGKVINGF